MNQIMRMDQGTGGFPQCPGPGWPPPGCPPWYSGMTSPPWYPGANGAISFSTNAPSNPVRGHLWWDGTTMWMWDGAGWIDITGSGSGGGGGSTGGAFVGANPPAGPQVGQLWFNTTTDTLFTWDGFEWLSASPTGVTVASSAPSNPTIGDFWYNTGNDFLYIWDGNAWVLSSVDAFTVISATAPAPPRDGMLWHDTSNGVLYVYDGPTGQWIPAHPVSSTSGPSPPANPQPGEMWWDTANSSMFIYDGSQWVATTMTGPPPVGGINYVGPAPPTNPSVGELWYNTTNDQMSIWDGAAWHLAQGITGPQGVPGPQGPPGPGWADAPMDGNGYFRTNGGWASGGQIANGMNIQGFITCYNPPNGSGAGTAAIECHNASSVFNFQCWNELTGDMMGFWYGGASNSLFPNANQIGQILSPDGYTIQYQSNSDARLKTDIIDLDDFGAIIDALRPVRFRWKAQTKNSRLSHGFLAQDVQHVYPEAAMPSTAERPRGTDPGKLVCVLTAAIKDLRKRIAELEGRNGRRR